MAINYWRPVLTDHWPMATNSNTKRGSGTPSTATPVLTESWPMATNSNTTTQTTNPFSNADVYKLQSQWYYDQWNTALWDAYKSLRQWSNAFSNTANQITDFYNQLWQDVYKREMWLAWVKTDLANKLYDDMSQQRQYVMNTFWPNWTLTSEINKYYDDLWNYLSTDAGRQAANIAAQWMHSWASLWAIRAQQNEAYNESFARYVQAKEQEINAKQTIAGNLINYMSTLRKEYWDTTNQYIISQYQRANDLLNTISQSIADANVQLATARLNAGLGGGWWSSSSGVSAIDIATLKSLWYTTDEIRQMYWLPVSETNSQYAHSDDNLNN